VLNEPQIFDAICHKVRNWKRFGRLIGVEESMLNHIDLNKNNKEDRLYACLDYKKDSSVFPKRWGFLKKRLLKFTEGGDIVHTLEKRLPTLLHSVIEQNTHEG